MYLTRPTILTLLMVILFCSSVLAQRPGPEFRRPLACEPLEPRTQLEAIESRYERVLVKGFSQIATLSVRGADIRVDAVDLKDVSADASHRDRNNHSRDGRNPRENRAFIDYEEVQRLVKAIDTVARVNEAVTKLAGFEAHYRTLGDLEINVFRQSRSGTSASVSSGICERVTGLLTLDELDRLKAHIVEAKARLDEVK
ncbi:MAG: hypothetical protein ABR501_03300 [Pyrinomonadaceae bacterium]